jgi:hypothetical protein
MPATNGDAIEVPDILPKAVVDPLYADEMLEPGANTSTHVPKLEYDARESLDAVAPTVIAESALAGE